MTNFTKQPNLDAMKANLPSLKQMIKRTLRVDAGNGSALDIQAVAEGFNDYNTAKGLSDKDFYCVKSNLGSKDQPFYVERALGYQEHDVDGHRAAISALSDCKSFMTWYLFKNDKNTGIKIETAPAPEKGFEYKIHLTGDTITDIECALEEVSQRIDNVMGFDSNDTGSFSFERVGDEYTQEDRLGKYITPSDFEYLILEGRSCLRFNDFEEAQQKWEHQKLNSNPGSALFFLEEISLDDASNEPDRNYHLVKDSASCFTGSYYYLLDTLDDEKVEFSLYSEIERF